MLALDAAAYLPSRSPGEGWTPLLINKESAVKPAHSKLFSDIKILKICLSQCHSNLYDFKSFYFIIETLGLDFAGRFYIYRLMDLVVYGF